VEPEEILDVVVVVSPSSVVNPIKFMMRMMGGRVSFSGNLVSLLKELEIETMRWWRIQIMCADLLS
jgi:hypothetical protein